MKLMRLAAVFGVILLAGYVIINVYELEIARSYIKIFPLQRDKSLAYWIDLTHMLYREFFILCLFIVATVYLAQYGNMQLLLQKFEGVILKRPPLTLSVIVFSFFILSIVVAVYVLDVFPNSSDEYDYLFQAEVISRGQLWDKPHPLPDFFDLFHLAQKQDKWISRFPPGWPLILAVAFILNIPAYIINPILGAITLLVLYKFCARFYNERIAVWSTLCTALTGCVIFNAGSFFSHTVSLLEFLLFVYFFYSYLDERRIYQLLLAGFFLGLLTITRYYTAFLLFIPFFIHLTYRYKFKAVVPLIFIGMGALPPLAYFLWYNYQVTGNPLLPVTMWAFNDEALGFVQGHTPMLGIQYIMRRILMFIAWVSPAFLILYMVLLWRKVKTSSQRLIHPEDYGFVLLMVGYFFYYHHGGNQYGPRFYFEAIPFVIVFVVAKVLQVNNRWALALLLTGFIYAVVKIPLIAVREHAITKEREDVYVQVAKKGIHHAVVFLSTGTGLKRPLADKDLTRNDKHYQNDVIYALDLKEKNHALMQYYKDRDFYSYQRGMEEVSGHLIKIRSAEGNLAAQTGKR
jgi:hypothetical protein